MRSPIRPALTDPSQVEPLLPAIRGYTGTPTLKGALLPAHYTLVRPREFRQLRWEDLELTCPNPRWVIAAH